jgi:hypothetical protein
MPDLTGRISFEIHFDNTVPPAETDPILTEMMLEGIIRWLTETPYPDPYHRMPLQYQELHKQQATIGWDQMLYG